MARLPKEYIRSIVPEGMKKGEELLKEGWEIGKTFEAKPSKYFTSRGYRNAIEKRNAELAKGKITGYSINVGLATAQETLDAILRLHKWTKENCDIEFASGLLLPSMQVGIPKEKRDRKLDTTSYMMETLEDYEMFNREEVFMPLSNFCTVCPNAIETTVNCLKAGLTNLGTTSQLPWDYPGCDNHIEDTENIVRAIGIIQSKMEDVHPTMGCYVEDGLAGCCVDTVSCVASFLFDQYIFSKLCGIPLTACFGGLISDIKTRAALMKALNELAEEEGGYLSFVHGCTTTQWDHDVNANFGSSSAEVLLTYLAEDHYKTGCTIHFIPVTEAITVPTEQELKDSIACMSRVGEYVEAYRNLIDWTEIDERAEFLKTEGVKMFKNILTTLKEAGVDITDPVPLIKFCKSVDSSLFEQSFHPSVWDGGEFKAYYPNDMGALTLSLVDETLAALKAKGYGESILKGHRILVASSDVHAYGSRYVHLVLSAMGADIVDIGVDNTVQAMLDMAKEEGIKYIGVSTHSGNAIAVGNYFNHFITEQNLNCKVFMGGVLTSILPGHTEPSQVADLLNEKEHILATNDLEEVIKLILG